MNKFIILFALLFLSFSAFAKEFWSCCGHVTVFETNSVGYSVTVDEASGPMCTVGFSDKEIEKKATPIILAGLNNKKLTVCLFYYLDNSGLKSISIQGE
jgi:hypothetical protein